MKLITSLFALFLVTIIMLADTGRLVFSHWLTANNLDKAGHFILYGIMTLLLDLTFIRTLPHLSRRLILLRVAMIFSLIIGAEEYSQQFFANRTFSLVDLAFSYLGVVFFSWVAIKM